MHEILNMFIRLTITIAITYALYIVVIIGILWKTEINPNVNQWKQTVKGKRRKKEIVKQTKNQKQQIKENFNNLSLKGTEEEMLSEIKQYLKKYIDKTEKNKTDEDFTEGYVEGTLTMANILLDKINKVEEPINGVWKEDFNRALGDMVLEKELTKHEKEVLFDKARNEFEGDYDRRNREIREFIEKSILDINQEKFGIFAFGTLVKVRDDMTIGEKYGGITYTESMDEYKGRTSLITRTEKDDNGKNQYMLGIDVNESPWSKEMLDILQNP